jgi:Uncharacterized conserved protein
MPQFISDARGPFGRNVESTGAIRRAIHDAGRATPVICTGGIHNFEMAEKLLVEGQCDVIGAARQSLADPDWFRKMSLGLGDQVRVCEYTNYCEGLDQKHKPVTCKLWDKVEPGDDARRTADGKRRLTAPAWQPPHSVARLSFPAAKSHIRRTGLQPIRTNQIMPAPDQRLPTLFIPHGGGPWPFMEVSFGPPDTWDRLAGYLRGLDHSLGGRPKAVLVISGHWETERPTVNVGRHPPLLFDYYGFPKHTYELRYPASGSPELARRVRELLSAAGIASDEDDARGFDHGVFVPFMLVYPDADVPVVQLSLQAKPRPGGAPCDRSRACAAAR